MSEKTAKRIVISLICLIVLFTIFFRYLDTQSFRYTISREAEYTGASKGLLTVSFSYLVDGEEYKSTNRFTNDELSLFKKHSPYIVKYSTIYPGYARILLDFSLSKNEILTIPVDGWKENPLKNRRTKSLERE